MSEQTKELDIVERARERAWAEPEPNDLTRLLSALIEEIERLRAERPGWRAAIEQAAAMADSYGRGSGNNAVGKRCHLVAKAIRALHPSVAEGREKNNSADAAASPFDHNTKR